MQNLKEFLNERETVKKKETVNMPNVLIMRRQSIRTFPNGKKVALYYIDKLKKVVTIPFDDMAWSGSEEIELEVEQELEENIIHHLNGIVTNHQGKRIKFKDGSSSHVDAVTARAVLNVHNSLNDENKKKVSEMAHKSKKHFLKVVDFAWKHHK